MSIYIGGVYQGNIYDVNEWTTSDNFVKIIASTNQTNRGSDGYTWLDLETAFVSSI